MTSARRKAERSRVKAKQRKQRITTPRAIIEYATKLAERVTSGEMSAVDMEYELDDYLTPKQRGDISVAAFLAGSAPLTDSMYWAQFRAMWDGLSTPSDYLPIWRAVFVNPRGEGDRHMFNLPRESFPEVVTIYRGVRHESYVHGLSWTTDHAMAERFARDKGSRWTRDGYWPSDPPVPVEPILVTGLVDRDDIVCCFRHPTCDELVILPEYIGVLSVERLDAEPEAAYDAPDKQTQSGAATLGTSGPMAHEE